jgi:hypothetical protein
MTKLLRYQASMLVRIAFTRKLTVFRFDAGHAANALHKNLPLDISLLALLVEGAMHGDDSEVPSPDSYSYVRRAIRGQNLDRAGLAARHMKVLNVLSDPKDASELAETLGWNLDEVRQVLSALVMAELVEQRSHAVAGQFVVFEPDAGAAQNLRASLEDSDNRYVGKVVRDKLALQLVLKRSVPHTLVFAGDDDSACQLVEKLFATQNPKAASVRRIALVGNDGPQDVDWNSRVGFGPDEVIARPCTAELLFRAMDRLLDNQTGTEQHVETTSPADAEPHDLHGAAGHEADMHNIEAITAGAES